MSPSKTTAEQQIARRAEAWAEYVEDWGGEQYLNEEGPRVHWCAGYNARDAEVEALEQTARVNYGLYKSAEFDVEALEQRIAAVARICDKALAVKVAGSDEGETAMAALASVVKREALSSPAAGNERND